MENLGRAFSYMFEDKDWIQKILIGAVMVLFSWLLIPTFFLLGYMLEVARRSSEGNELPLPNWDDWGNRLVQGLLYFVIVVIYSIPIGILSLILQFIPCIGFLLSLGLFIGYLIILPYITVRFARTGNFNDAFDFNGLIEFVKTNIAQLAIVAVMTIIISFVASLGILALGVGVLLTYFWANLAIYYLFGQVYMNAEKSGEVVVETSDSAPEKPDAGEDSSSEAGDSDQ